MEDVARIIKKLLIKEPFYGLFLMGLSRKEDPNIDTMGVGIEGINPVLYINIPFGVLLFCKQLLSLH